MDEQEARDHLERCLRALNGYDLATLAEAWRLAEEVFAPYSPLLTELLTPAGWAQLSDEERQEALLQLARLNALSRVARRPGDRK